MPSIQFIATDGIATTAQAPLHASEGAAGVDIAAAISHPLYLFPAQTILVPTGLRVAIPAGYELQIRPRSGIALRNQVLLPNAPGTIDSDYRGEIKVLMRNIGDSIFIIRPGDRVAQLVCAQALPIRWQRQTTLPDSTRSQGGFGSTGK